MILRVCCILAVVYAAAGCTIQTIPFELPSNHPANPLAYEMPFTPPANPFANDVSLPASQTIAPSTDHHHDRSLNHDPNHLKDSGAKTGHESHMAPPPPDKKSEDSHRTHGETHP